MIKAVLVSLTLVCRQLFLFYSIEEYFFLEKPLTENYAKTLKLFKHLKENKIKYYLNFIFPKIKSFKVFYDLIKDKKIVRGIYT